MSTHTDKTMGTVGQMLMADINLCLDKLIYKGQALISQNIIFGGHN
jgi:hypothetical protein